MDPSETLLLRLRDVIDEAKGICMRLRTTGHRAEAEAAAAELMNSVRAPLGSAPWEPVDHHYQNDVWAGGMGEEMNAPSAPLGGAPWEQVDPHYSHEVWPGGMEEGGPNGMNNFDSPDEYGPYGKDDDQKNGKWGGMGKEKGRKGKKSGDARNANAGSSLRQGGENSVWRPPTRGTWGKQVPSDPSQADDITYAFVEFKRGRVRKYVSVPDIPPGKYVMVDGDRGQDCGLLVQTIRKMQGKDDEIVCMEGTNIEDKLKLEDGRVIRLASEEEVRRLHSVIASAEALALKTCRDRCKELNIELGLVDVEYQYDMKKISFFFDCDHSVDFRSLVRELYRSFGARIWMENINPKVRNSMPDAANSGAEGNGNWGGNNAAANAAGNGSNNRNRKN